MNSCLFTRRIATLSITAGLSLFLIGGASPVAAQYAAAVLADKPVAYYRLNEAAGNMVQNSAASGAINDGVVVTGNGTAVVRKQAGALAGDPNAAYTFGGDYVSVPRTIQDDFTIEFFFRTMDPGPGNGLQGYFDGSGLVNNDAPGVKDDFGTSFSGGRVLFGVGNVLGATPGTPDSGLLRDLTIRSQAGLNDGRYHLVDAVRERASGTIRLYVDGVSVTSATGGTQSLTALPYIHIGHTPRFGLTPGRKTVFTGSIDEVALYAVPLSPDRIKAHYAAALTEPVSGTAAPPVGLTVTAFKKLAGHSEYVNSVAFSPDGKTLATGSRDKTVRLWNIETGEQRVIGKHDNFVSCVAFSPDGRYVASGGWDNRIKQFDIIKGDELSEGKFDKHTNYVLALAFSPNGRRLVSGSNDKTARNASVSTGASVVTTDLPNAVASIAFSPDGSHIVGACLDGKVYVWETATLHLSRTLGVPGVDTPVFAAVFLDNDTVAASGKSGVIRVWSIHDGKVTATLAASGREVFCLAYEPRRHLLASGGADRTIRVWNFRAIKQAKGGNTPPAATVTGHENTVRTVAFSPDGDYLASGGWDFLVRLWHVTEGEARDSLWIDNMEDFSKMAAHTPGWAVETTGSENADNSLSRLKRTTDTPQEVIYHVEDLRSFAARVYFAGDLTGKVACSVSRDNTTWTPAPILSDPPVLNAANWRRTTLRARSLPAGTNYLKIQFSNDPVIFSPQLSEVRLVSPGNSGP